MNLQPTLQPQTRKSGAEKVIFPVEQEPCHSSTLQNGNDPFKSPRAHSDFVLKVLPRTTSKKVTNTPRDYNRKNLETLPRQLDKMFVKTVINKIKSFDINTGLSVVRCSDRQVGLLNSLLKLKQLRLLRRLSHNKVDCFFVLFVFDSLSRRRYI